MNINELMAKILEVLPNASVGDDNDGQLVIYTDMQIVGADEVIPFEER